VSQLPVKTVEKETIAGTDPNHTTAGTDPNTPNHAEYRKCFKPEFVNQEIQIFRELGFFSSGTPVIACNT